MTWTMDRPTEWLNESPMDGTLKKKNEVRTSGRNVGMERWMNEWIVRKECLNGRIKWMDEHPNYMNNQKKTAVVTGATGFIGSALTSSLLNNDYNVIAVIKKPAVLPKGCIAYLCDILDYESISETISRSDIVFHLAGIVGVTPCEDDLYKTIDVNIVGTINVLDAAKYYNKPLIFASVSNIYDHSFYSITKATAERFVMMYNKEHKTNFMPLRIFNVYGPRQDLKSGKLITNAIDRGLKGKPIFIFGKGNQIMDFIYIDDVVSHLLYASDNISVNDYKPYEVGTGTGITIKNAVNVIIKATGNQSEIIFKPKRSGEKMNNVVANKARFITNTIDMHKFEVGIMKTVESIKVND